MEVFKRVKAWSESRGISAQEPFSSLTWKLFVGHLSATHSVLKVCGVSGYMLNKLEELQEYAEAKQEHDENGGIDAIADSMVYDMTELLKEGYDVELVIHEVLKVVESRTGQWDDGLGKFVKDKSPEAQARWYTPDYVNNCKLKCPKSYIGDLFEGQDNG